MRPQMPMPRTNWLQQLDHPTALLLLLPVLL
jgi:hypothetical protein